MMGGSTEAGAFVHEDPQVCTGIVGAKTCCDVMKLQLSVDDRGFVIRAEFRAFGCRTARAIASYVADYLRGKPLAAAEAITRTRLVESLALPPQEVHCAALAEEAVRAVVEQHRNRGKTP